MAKKNSDIEDPQNEGTVPAEQNPSRVKPMSAPVVPTSGQVGDSPEGDGNTPNEPEPSPDSNYNPTPVPGELPIHLDRTLEVYPRYLTLYLDHHGGAYTPDTDPVIRKDAKLYTNPYFKQ